MSRSELFKAADARATMCVCGHNSARHIHEGAFPGPRGAAPCFGEELDGGCDCPDFVERREKK